MPEGGQVKSTKIIQDLNFEQQKAVLTESPRVLVLAGAGTGKTLTLTKKIQHLLSSGYSGNEILALSFTNKAAKEMKDRLAKVVNPADMRRMWITTFHGFCLKILRQYGWNIGFEKGISVYDEDEALEVMVQVNEELGQKFSTKKLREMLEVFQDEDIMTGRGPAMDDVAKTMFKDYCYRLMQFNAVYYTRMMTKV